VSRSKYINQRDIAYPGCRECIANFQAFKVACVGHTPPCYRFDRGESIHHQLEKALRQLPEVRVTQ